MTTAELDQIVAESLHSFFADIAKGDWLGREREMVSLFAFGHLAPLFAATRGLSMTQIGIEVAVRQLPGERRRKNVCKDLVIWPAERMTFWSKDGQDSNEPQAVIEWKVNHFLNGPAHRKNRQDAASDVRWLKETSQRLADREFVGYAVVVESTRSPREMSVERIFRGVSMPWMRLPR